ncbi:MAG: hypothetical protein KAG92_01345 [Deltaproteobacteria bacterium]|nr:hypothetical protein [Deltaproteobacteria bacterium]
MRTIFCLGMVLFLFPFSIEKTAFIIFVNAWLTLAHPFQNVSKSIKETISVAEANISSGFLTPQATT